jgi:hypothetical protein
MSHGLDGPRLKLGRANVHLESLKEQVQRFIDGNPYGAVAEYDGQTEKCVLRTQIFVPPPQDWGIIIGDIAHNLRSALDQLVWQLACTQTATPFDKTAFPIFDVFTKYRDNGRIVIQNLTPRQKTLVRRLQPYHRGNRAIEHPLWLLQNINNTDKHRVIQTIGAVFDVRGLGFGNLWGFDLYNMNVYGGQRLEEGAPIADFTLVQTAPDARMDMHPEIIPTIEFGKGSNTVEGMPLIATLSDILTHVERVIGIFGRQFP